MKYINLFVCARISQHVFNRLLLMLPIAVATESLISHFFLFLSYIPMKILLMKA